MGRWVGELGGKNEGAVSDKLTKESEIYLCRSEQDIGIFCHSKAVKKLSYFYCTYFVHIKFDSQVTLIKKKL